MPVKQCSVDGKPGYKFGDSGHCYTYEAGNAKSQAEARLKAEMQAKAEYANGYKGSGGK